MKYKVPRYRAPGTAQQVSAMPIVVVGNYALLDRLWVPTVGQAVIWGGLYDTRINPIARVIHDAHHEP